MDPRHRRPSWARFTLSRIMAAVAGAALLFAALRVPSLRFGAALLVGYATPIILVHGLSLGLERWNRADRREEESRPGWED